MTLAELIATNPTFDSLAGTRDFEAVLAWLNDPQADTQLQERLCTDRTILAEVINPTNGLVDPVWANAILDKLDAAAQASSMVKRAMNRVYGDGLDIGNVATQAQLDALAVAGAITQAEADAIKALGFVPCSRAMKHLGLPATLQALWDLYPAPQPPEEITP